MKRVFPLVVAAMMLSSAAMATDLIGVFTNASGTDCNLAGGVSTTATVVYKGFTPGGSTGARFRVDAPPGSTIFGFTTPWVTIGTIADDLSIAFGMCIEGTFPLGTIAASWAAGHGYVAGSGPFPLFPLMTDCNFGEYPVIGEEFCVAAPGPCECCVACDIATEQSTWGKVKSLYR